MGYNPITPGGYSMWTMSSMLQKAIRRGDIDHASFAAKEMRGSYLKYLWKRLLVISVEDCYGVVTKEIVGLKMADDIANEGRKGYDRDPLFLSKAVVLLCMARKNRDACYVACNFMRMDRILTPDEIPECYLENVDQAKLGVDGVPDWVFDIHTLQGRRNGKTDLDMTIDEEAALFPHQMSLFDNADWGPYYKRETEKGNIGYREQQAVKQFQKGKETDPTHGGQDMPVRESVFGAIKNGRVVEDPDFDIPD